MVIWLTENFNLDEFKCKDGTPVPEEYLDNIQYLAEQLQIIRNHIGKSIRITSGYRSKAHNARTPGASKRSQHLYGRAADIKVKGWSGPKLAGFIEGLIATGRLHNGGLGVYHNRVHYDTRETPARWNHNG